MSEASISRRSLLRGLAALAAFRRFVPAAAASDRSDARLLALWEKWQASCEGIGETYDELESIRRRVERLGLPKWRPLMSVAEEEAQEAANAAAYEEAGYEAAERQNEELWERLRTAQQEMGQEDADSLLGVILRVRVLASWQNPVIWGGSTGLIAAIRCDLERLAAHAGLYLPVNDATEQWHCESEAAVERSEREQIAAGFVWVHQDSSCRPPVGRRACDMIAPGSRGRGALLGGMHSGADLVLGRAPSGCADTRLVDLWQEWQARYMAWIAAYDAERALWPEWPGCSASRQERGAYADACAALRETPDCKAAEERTQAAWDKVWATECEIAKGEAEGLMGFFVRARAMSSWTCVDRREQDICLLTALRRDLERLAGDAGPVPPVNPSVAEWHEIVETTAKLRCPDRQA